MKLRCIPVTNEINIKNMIIMLYIISITLPEHVLASKYFATPGTNKGVNPGTYNILPVKVDQVLHALPVKLLLFSRRCPAEDAAEPVLSPPLLITTTDLIENHLSAA